MSHPLLRCLDGHVGELWERVSCGFVWEFQGVQRWVEWLRRVADLEKAFFGAVAVEARVSQGGPYHL